MNILLVTNGFPPSAFGGVEIYTSDLAQKLFEKGHAVTVFCRESNLSLPDYQVSDDKESGIRVIRVINDYKEISSFRGHFTDEKIEAIFLKYLTEIAPDIIHFNHFIALSANLPLIALGHKIPFITTLHDYWPLCQRVKLIDWKNRLCPGPQKGGNCFVCVKGGEDLQVITVRSTRLVKLIKTVTTPGLRNWVRRVFFRKTRVEPEQSEAFLSRDIFRERYDLFKSAITANQRILVPSEYVRIQYAANGYPSEKIDVIPLGVNIPRGEHKISQNPNRIIFGVVGSIIWTKGIHVLVNAFRKTKGNNIRLQIFGREDLDPTYSKEIREMSANDQRIEFMGSFPPDQRGAIFEKIDVVVIPSIFPETFSLVAREALLSGKPVIASRIGALAEVIVDRVNGFLFDPQDNEELAKIISEIADDPQMLNRLDLPGPRQIDPLEDHANLIVKVYEEVLAEYQSDE
jgi:glycosyltransferase involved in cell wall biosynthesis